MHSSSHDSPSSQSDDLTSGDVFADQLEAESGVQLIARPPAPASGESSLRIVYQCLTAMAKAGDPGALRDSVSEMLVSEAGYLASWFFDWASLKSRSTLGAFRAKDGSARPVPFVYKNAVHRALKLRHETHGKAKLANFIAPPLDEELGLGRSSDATPLSRCLILPIQVRGKFVAGLVVCADNAKRLDTNSARVLGEVARHVAQRLAELEVTGHRKTPKTTPNETRPVLSIVPAVTPNPSERPTVRLGGQGRAQYVDVVIPASAQLKGDLGNLASVKINEDPLLIAARDLVHELSTQVSVIVAYSDTNFLAHRTAEGHKEDAATIWNAGKQAAAIVRKLQKTLRG